MDHVVMYLWLPSLKILPSSLEVPGSGLLTSLILYVFLFFIIASLILSECMKCGFVMDLTISVYNLCHHDRTNVYAQPQVPSLLKMVIWLLCCIVSRHDPPVLLVNINHPLV